MSDKCYALWRIIGEFKLSEIPENISHKSNNFILKWIIENDPNYTKEDKKFMIEEAFNYDSPYFIGYEMAIVFKGEVVQV